MTTADKPVFRFAPSPTGPLHLGHALSALINFDLCKRAGGRMLVRIEDIDTARCSEHFVEQTLVDLAWLGLTWEEPVLRQSTRFVAYAQAAQTLDDRGLLYRCAATRREINAALEGAETDPDGAPRYRPICGAGACAGIAEPTCSRGDTGARHASAVRLNMMAATATLGGSQLTYSAWDGADGFEPTSADPTVWGDAIVVRKDTPTSYHLACVVDDAAQGVTHIVRGSDLEKATDFQRLLQVILGLPAPVYYHHHLLRDPDGRKLAKRDKDTALQQYRADGVTPGEIRRLVGL